MNSGRAERRSLLALLEGGAGAALELALGALGALLRLLPLRARDDRRLPEEVLQPVLRVLPLARLEPLDGLRHALGGELSRPRSDLPLPRSAAGPSDESLVPRTQHNKGKPVT